MYSLARPNSLSSFFFNDTATTEIYTLSLHDALPISAQGIVVLVEHEGRDVALLVDELLGQQPVVIKGLEANFQKVAGVAGPTILSDGGVALILDVPGLVALSRARSGNGGGR